MLLQVTLLTPYYYRSCGRELPRLDSKQLQATRTRRAEWIWPCWIIKIIPRRLACLLVKMTAPSFGLWGSSNITESIILRSHKRKMTRVSAVRQHSASGNIQDFFSIQHQDCKISNSLTEIHQCNNQRFHLKLSPDSRQLLKNWQNKKGSVPS